MAPMKAIRFTRGRRAHVHITGRSGTGHLVVLVIGEYRGQWRVKRAEYRICRPSGIPLGKDETMLVPKWATTFVARRGRTAR